MNIKMVDLSVHINEDTDHDTREKMQDKLRALNGIMGATSHDDKSHLLVVSYNPDVVTSKDILNCVKENGVHAQLFGL